MPQTRVSCPRCRQPVTANIEQLFDLNADPQAKQRLLSGSTNLINCPNCGYQGAYPTPIVYHDPGKELLLTYFPPEMGVPLNEQERLIGPMINQVVNKLPNEKRKAYLLRPQSMLTFQTLMEKILASDGITKEMLDAQQQRLSLLQRLLAAPVPSRPEIIHNEDALIDESFFTMLNRLLEASLSGGSEQTARQMAELQEVLISRVLHRQEDQRSGRRNSGCRRPASGSQPERPHPRVPAGHAHQRTHRNPPDGAGQPRPQRAGLFLLPDPLGSYRKSQRG